MLIDSENHADNQEVCEFWRIFEEGNDEKE
jgi:hypothetical protein